MKKRFFALLLCLALCLSLIPAAAAAEITLVPPPADEPARTVASGKCGESLRWTLDDQYTLTITGSGNMWDFEDSGDNEQPWYSYTGRIENIVISDSVHSIGKKAFSLCNRLKSVKIGKSLRSIGEQAFYFCSRLESITIPDSVQRIDAFAFDCCKSLQSITLGSGVSEIGLGAFYECLSLQEVVFRGEAPSIRSSVFEYDALVAYYPADDESWTDSVRQSYGGFVLWVPDDGPRITLTSYDAEFADGAHFTGGGTLSGGVCPFTLSNYKDRAALAAVKDGDRYTALPCTTDADGVHHFTLTADGDTEMVLALKGDVNLDGQLKGTDGTMLKRAVLGSYHYPEDCKALCELVADLNGDGTIKGSEGTQIARAVLGTHTIPW